MSVASHVTIILAISLAVGVVGAAIGQVAYGILLGMIVMGGIVQVSQLFATSCEKKKSMMKLQQQQKIKKKKIKTKQKNKT